MIEIVMVAAASIITFALACLASVIGWLALSELENHRPDMHFVWAATVVWLGVNLLAGWVAFALGGSLA